LDWGSQDPPGYAPVGDREQVVDALQDGQFEPCSCSHHQQQHQSPGRPRLAHLAANKHLSPTSSSSAERARLRAAAKRGLAAAPVQQRHGKVCMPADVCEVIAFR